MTLKGKCLLGICEEKGRWLGFKREEVDGTKEMRCTSDVNLKRKEGSKICSEDNDEQLHAAYYNGQILLRRFEALLQ